MAGNDKDAGDELNSSEGSPNPSSRSDGHLDSAPSHGSSSDADLHSDAGVAEDSIAAAFPPEQDDDSLDDSTGPSWTQDVEEDEEESAAGAKTSGGVVAGVKSFFLDSKEDRQLRKLEREAGQSNAKGKGKQSKNRAATAVARPTKVSRRARLLGGKRGRAVLFQCAVILALVLTVVSLAVGLTRPSQDDIEDRVAEAVREAGQDFPRGQAVAWADQLVIDWGTWDEDDTDEREVRLAQYLTAGMDSQAGWNGDGTQEVVFTSANPEPIVIDSNRALVNVDYRLDDDSRRCVSVPVYAYQPEGLTGEGSQWAFGLSSNPIPRPCAPRTGAMEDVDDPEEQEDEENLTADDELARELNASFFPGFFSAWAASDADSLRQYSASGVTTIGLGGAMSSTPPPSIGDVSIMTPQDGEPSEGTVYTATVPVTWTVSGSTAQVTATYDVPMRQSGDRWYVAGEPSPSAATSSAGSGSPAERVDPQDDTESGDQSDDSSSDTTDSESGE